MQYLVPLMARSFYSDYFMFTPMLALLFLLMLPALSSLRKAFLVVYNVQEDELRQILKEIAPRLDAESVWAGNALAMPTLDMELRLEYDRRTRNGLLCVVRAPKNVEIWECLERTLKAELAAKQ